MSEPTEVAEEDPAPTLDPETRARRDAALTLVRKHGDPVLRSRALPIDRFDDALRDEIRRMGQVMHDALGIGLAATQVGVMHRVLVYRVETEAAIAALVNPVLEWAGDEREPLEEGCLSLPGVLVEVERPVHVRVRAQDERGEAILIEASGLEARVIQHEMDHLDGVLILDRTSRDQRKEAMRALREALAAPLGAPPRRRRCAPSISAPRRSPPPCSSGSPRARTARRSSSPGRTGPRAAGGRCSRRRSPTRRGRSASTLIAARGRSTRPTSSRGSRPQTPGRAGRLRLRGARPEPLLSDYEIFNVHPSLLPRWRGAAPVERAIMAGDAETGVSIMRLTAGLDSGPVCLAAATPIGPDDDYGTLAARLQALAGELLVRALDERPPWVEQDAAGVTYAHKIEAADRALDPTRRPERPSGRSAPCGRTSARGSRCPTAASWACCAARVDGPTLAPAGGRVRTDGERLLLDCRGGALELTEIRPPAGAADGCRRLAARAPGCRR